MYYTWNMKTILNKQLDRDKSLLPASRYFFMTSFSLFPSIHQMARHYLSIKFLSVSMVEQGEKRSRDYSGLPSPGISCRHFFLPQD